MCGIIGIVSKRNIIEILISCLYKLEYRGYDSSGLAIIDENFFLRRFREIGKVKILADKVIKKSIFGLTGIAHTRWATHGKPTINNTHPHISEHIAIVHNGIIENYQELKAGLKKKKYIFTSETDSEVIAHLIHLELKKNRTLIQGVKNITKKLKGTYSIVIMDCKNPGLLVGVRSGSPLIIGLGVGENFFSSDQFALLNFTNNFIYLEEGDIAEITCKNICIFNKKGVAVKRKKIRYDSKYDIYNKGNYFHYMEKEIYEQPISIKSTLNGFLDEKDNIFFNEFSRSDRDILIKIENVQILACGSSYNAGLVARYWFESLLGISCNVEIASEYIYRTMIIKENTLLIFISQSGETADILSALRLSKKYNNYLMSLSICNVLNSSLIRESNFSLITQAGIEVSVASTKCFTTQLITLLLLVAYFLKIKKKNNALVKKIISKLRVLPDKINNILSENHNIKFIAKDFFDKKNAIFLGRDIHFPIALEGALKLKEVSYIHAEAFPAGELKHGPIALIDKHMPVIFIAPNDKLLEKIKCSVNEVYARGGLVYIFTEKNVKFIRSKSVKIIQLPFIEDLISPIFYTIPFQLLSYYVALIKGKNIDQPRNLAKSVTVE